MVRRLEGASPEVPLSLHTNEYDLLEMQEEISSSTSSSILISCWNVTTESQWQSTFGAKSTINAAQLLAHNHERRRRLQTIDPMAID